MARIMPFPCEPQSDLRVDEGGEEPDAEADAGHRGLVDPAGTGSLYGPLPVHEDGRMSQGASGSVNPVSFTAGSGETVLPPPDEDAAAATAAALAEPPERRRAALSVVAARWPRHLDAWAGLAEVASPDADRYAFARVGYHRGLDALRAAGWRGSGYVRWAHPENRGFLRSLEALRATAEAIGEEDEAERCRLFLRQLDPDWRA
jgi:Protein of unknown function (DUF3151)